MKETTEHPRPFHPQPNFLVFTLSRNKRHPSPNSIKKRLHLCRLSPRVPVGARHFPRPVRIRGVPPPGGPSWEVHNLTLIKLPFHCQPEKVTRGVEEKKLESSDGTPALAA
ncbi:hypothetical protein HNY73_008027 [Argiope bruennichi]|uniref:Uncharacterized protein n=1 Tax=Argiope bruennichi TaxID=94029 RepID=A0A8T0F509_ARGBR|nr:hypothetical protein HNY73_008027 [Argiope bruennichi]